MWQRIMRIFQVNRLCLNALWELVLLTTLKKHAFDYDARFEIIEAIVVLNRRIKCGIPLLEITNN
jgi:hypothetical protein